MASKTRKPAAARAATATPLSPKLDARPDRLDLRDLVYRSPLRSLPPRWPMDSDLKKLLPAYVKAGRILNQGNEGACTGFGLACVTNMRSLPSRVVLEPLLQRLLKPVTAVLGLLVGLSASGDWQTLLLSRHAGPFGVAGLVSVVPS